VFACKSIIPLFCCYSQAQIVPIQKHPVAPDGYGPQGLPPTGAGAGVDEGTGYGVGLGATGLGATGVGLGATGVGLGATGVGLGATGVGLGATGVGVGLDTGAATGVGLGVGLDTGTGVGLGVTTASHAVRSPKITQVSVALLNRVADDHCVRNLNPGVALIVTPPVAPIVT
jgi:hypothetical protein